MGDWIENMCDLPSASCLLPVAMGEDGPTDEKTDPNDKGHPHPQP